MRLHLLCAAFLPCFGGLAAQEPAPAAPNVILLMADDLGFGDVGFTGNQTVRTPHLDRLAREGVRLDRFYAAAPVCSPTRASCLTGRHPYRSGITWAFAGALPTAELTIAEALGQAGYAPAHLGKWHVGHLSRTLKQGVHVHDCVTFGGAWYAVGSGATSAEWKASNIHSIMWKSADRGKTFKVHDRRSNQKVGDIRWTRLLPIGKTMWMFGYHSNNAGNPTELINATFDGTKRTDLAKTHELNNAWVFETHPISAKLGIARGVKILTVPKLIWSTWAIDDKGGIKAILPNKRILDVYPVGDTGEFLVMTHDEAEVDKIKALKSFQLRVLATKDFVKFTEVLKWSATSTPKSVAYWKGDLYIGDRLGAIWKAKAN